MFVAIKSIAKAESLLFNQMYKFSIIKFNLPDLGQKIKQGTIKKLYIQQGDTVEEFQKLADVASDKQFTEITASDAGIITKIHYSQEDICQVGDLFLEIKTADQAGSKQEPQVVEKVKQSSQSVQQTQQNKQSSSASGSNANALATPFVRGLIKKYNLTIDSIQGSGPDGRILQADVEAVAKGDKPKRVPSIQFGKRGPQQQTKETVKVASKPSGKSSTTSTADSSQVMKMSLFEKGMQKSMTLSNTIPTLYLHEQIDLTECDKLRSTLKANSKKVTVMGLLIKTFSLALKKYPIINSTYQPQKNQFEYTKHYNHNISIAIDTPNGLVVPNIRNVQTLNLMDIQAEIERLRNLAVSAKLTASELNNGTVCLSNIGTIGGVMANPLILPPQACIVAIGKLQTVGKYMDGHFVPRKVINVSFGCDHRIIDGATVARFSNQWKALLQNPYVAMAEMV